VADAEPSLFALPVVLSEIVAFPSLMESVSFWLRSSKAAFELASSFSSVVF